MWQNGGNNVEGDLFNFQASKMSDGSRWYKLNPEVFESNYYLYHFSKQQKYLHRAEGYLKDLISCCRCSNTDMQYDNHDDDPTCVGFHSLQFDQVPYTGTVW